MATRIMALEVPEELYQRFYHVVSSKLKSPKETYAKALQSALEVALTEFLDRIEKGGQEGAD